MLTEHQFEGECEPMTCNQYSWASVMLVIGSVLSLLLESVI